MKKLIAMVTSVALLGILAVPVFAQNSPNINNKLYEPVNMGPVPFKNPNIPSTLSVTGPEFKEVWPINNNGSQDTKSYYSFQGEKLITVTSRGAGKFVLIPDSRYFEPSNLEEEFKGNKSNIVFFQKLLKELKP